MISHMDMILRIAAGAAFGGVIGLERDIHGRQVGLRTHLIVAMASATFMVVSNYFPFFQHYDPSFKVEADVSRIAASVVTGIGFLAGGAILKSGLTVQGITTAAGLWLVTSIGLASGAGMYIEAGAVTIMGLIALTVLRLFEDKNDALVHRHVSLIMNDDNDQVTRALKTLEELGVKVSDFDYEKNVSESQVSVHFQARVPLTVGISEMIKSLEHEEGMEKIHVRARE